MGLVLVELLLFYLTSCTASWASIYRLVCQLEYCLSWAARAPDSGAMFPDSTQRVPCCVALGGSEASNLLNPKTLTPKWIKWVQQQLSLTKGWIGGCP